MPRSVPVVLSAFVQKEAGDVVFGIDTQRLDEPA